MEALEGHPAPLRPEADLVEMPDSELVALPVCAALDAAQLGRDLVETALRLLGSLGCCGRLHLQIANLALDLFEVASRTR